MNTFLNTKYNTIKVVIKRNQNRGDRYVNSKFKIRTREQRREEQRERGSSEAEADPLGLLPC